MKVALTRSAPLGRLSELLMGEEMRGRGIDTEPEFQPSEINQPAAQQGDSADAKIKK